MTTAVIVQARMGSSRLPGKVMKILGNKTVLRHVLDRCHAIEGADVVVCAIPDEEASEPVAAEAISAGAIVVRGSETDVLSRYAKAARTVGADTIMRVTSDCPLIDPETCAAVLKLRTTEAADYVCNNFTRTFPHGLDCEAFTRAALDEADGRATEPYDREHVTPWIRRAEHFERINYANPYGNFARERWTLDHLEDFDFLTQLQRVLPDSHIPSQLEVLAALNGHPAIRNINAMHHIVQT